jgi:hypothetical protein
MRRSTLPALLAVFLVCSCATPPRGIFGPICPAEEWAQKMAGDNCLDCGANHYDASNGQLKTLDRCIARGLTNKRNVALGNMAETPDSGFCAFAILSAESPPIVASYSYDYSFSNEDSRGRPHAFLGECQSVSVKKKRKDPGFPFEAEGCHQDRKHMTASLRNRCNLPNYSFKPTANTAVQLWWWAA